jgi:hypothetical protein
MTGPGKVHFQIFLNSAVFLTEVDLKAMRLHQKWSVVVVVVAPHHLRVTEKSETSTIGSAKVL